MKHTYDIFLKTNCSKRTNCNSTKSTDFCNTPLLLPRTISDQQQNNPHILQIFEDKLLKMDKLQFNKSTGFWRHPPSFASDNIRSTGKQRTHIKKIRRQIAIQQINRFLATPPFFCLGQYQINKKTTQTY